LGLHPTSSVKAAVQALLEETGLHRVASRLAGVLSHGDRKRLELAMALASRPRLLLLDEPTAGMSPEDRAASIRLLGRVTRDRGMSLLLTEHDMGVVFGLGTRLTVLNYGEVIATGMPEEVRRNPLVQEVYLGQNTNAA
jgi:branched-chain amino acid transport system ATP-binding protein